MNADLQSGLTWPQARAIARTGQLVRRALWMDWLMFQSGLWFKTPDGTFSGHVVRGAEFQRSEFLAQDWTNVAPGQNACVGLPPLTATLTLSAATVNDGDTVTGTVSIPEAQTTDTRFILSSLAPGIVSMPQSVIIAAGSTSVDFTITAPADGTPSISLMITASNATFGVAQAVLAVQEVDAPEPPAAPPQPVVQHLYYAQDIGGGGVINPPQIVGQQVIQNPFSAACSVYIQGYADDYLVVNGRKLGQAGGYTANEGYWCYTGFTLAAGGSFTIAALNTLRPEAEYDLQVTFTP